MFEPGAPTIDTKVFESGVPVLGIGDGFQVMAYELGGKVDKAALGEYGKTSATIDDATGILAHSPAGRPRGSATVWRSNRPRPASKCWPTPKARPWPPWRNDP